MGGKTDGSRRAVDQSQITVGESYLPRFQWSPRLKHAIPSLYSEPMFSSVTNCNGDRARRFKHTEGTHPFPDWRVNDKARSCLPCATHLPSLSPLHNATPLENTAPSQCFKCWHDTSARNYNIAKSRLMTNKFELSEKKKKKRAKIFITRQELLGWGYFAELVAVTYCKMAAAC